jgi:hypothetical protein
MMHACVIMHNKITKSERGDPSARDNHPYDHQGPLATVDHQLHVEFSAILATHEDFHDEVFFIKMIR